MIGFWLVNLLPPGQPLQFDIRTPSGVWHFQQSGNFGTVQRDIKEKGACANTFSMEFVLPTGGTRGAVKDEAFEETLPICLAASFVTGAAVTVQDALVGSEVAFVTTGAHFPRARGIGDPALCVGTLKEFIEFVERFVATYPRLNATEKILLLTHFFVDTCACWSLENLYLSGSTLLQIIAETEETSGRPFAANHAAARANKSTAKPAFFDYLAGAADRVGIPALGHDVVKIRNALIHDGTLNAPPFLSQADAAVPIAEAMRWVDDYVYAILQLGSVPRPRHAVNDLAFALNSFSFP